MTFKMYTPYSQLDIDIIENLGGFIHEIYPTLEELKEEEGEDSDYSIIEVDGVMLELDNYGCLYLDDISLN